MLAGFARSLFLLASIAILGPALARIARWPGSGGEQGAFVPVIVLALLAAMIGYDVVATRRVHAATLVGAIMVSASIAAGVILGASELGLALVCGLLV